MSKFKLRRPSPALFISVIALFVALGSGAYAASKINTGDIKNGAVTTKKLARQAVAPSKIERHGVKVNKIAPEAVDTGKIADLAVENSKLLSPAIWAFIDGSGTPSIVRTNLDSTTGAGATAVSREGTGHYKITWAPQDPSISGIDGCVTLAAAAGAGDGAGSERITQTNIDGSSGPTFETVVRTRDSSGTDMDSNFTAALFC